MDRERSARREEERVIVVGGDEGLDRDQPVRTGTVLDHDRLAPARRQPVCQQPRPDVRARAGAERHDEFHRSLRPSFSPCLRRPQRRQSEQGEQQRA